MRPSTGKNPQIRAHLTELGVDHQDRSDQDAVTLSYAISGVCGFPVLPRTTARSGPIIARVWLAAALNARGRYFAPDIPGHPANVEDGGQLIDSVILMAIVQRHFLSSFQSGWDDVALATSLGLPARDIERAQDVLDAVARLMDHSAANGVHWCERRLAVRS